MNSLCELLEGSAGRYPDRIAVEDPERQAKITYRELNAHAEDLKERLLRMGVVPGDRVGICLPKSIGSVVSIFGILKARAAYVPVAADAPASRNAFIFRNCSVKAMIVDPAALSGLESEFSDAPPSAPEPLDFLSVYHVELLAVPMPGTQETATQAPDRLAYILYTSGSTGKPKGVMHTHASALSFIDWCSETFDPTKDDRFSSHAPFHFDLSIFDIYVPLKHGAALVLIGEEAGKQPLGLAAFAAEERISVWYSTPSILRLIIEYGKPERHDYSALRTVCFAGEVFPIKYLRAIMELWPRPRYFNLYGPTETNVCTYFEVPSPLPDDWTEPVPIGRRCSGDRTMAMDANGREVRRGEEGELYVCGGSVMQGYWDLPERNAEAFYTDEAGDRWYRTGDVVKESEAGGYIFIGRRDRMVKRRGYRIELGEIEASLYRHPEIAEAAVIAEANEESGVLLRAFLSSTTGKPLSLIGLKGFCGKNLPSYMIPDAFSFLPSLPKTSTDKIDYQKLRELD